MREEKNILIRDMLTACDLSINTVSRISDRGGLASFSLAKIADYLDCSVDYLLGRKSEQEDMFASEREKMLITNFRNLSDQGQDYILQTMDMVKDKYKKPDSVSGMENIG